MYLKEFKIRWSEIDANRHVANAAFSNLFNETRVSYFSENGISVEAFAKFGIGPIVFSESFHYLKEIYPGETVRISLELLANMPDYRINHIVHCLFNQEKKLAVYAEIAFGFLDLTTRKLAIPPKEITDLFAAATKAENYSVLPDDFSLKNPRIPYGKQIP